MGEEGDRGKNGLTFFRFLNRAYGFIILIYVSVVGNWTRKLADFFSAFVKF